MTDTTQVPKYVCRQCGVTFDYSRNKGHRRTMCAICSVRNARHKRKKLALDYKGSCCQICKYDRCDRSLVFHHINPTTKDIKLTATNMCRNWEEVKKELDKCVLLCNNCHGEVHEGMHPEWLCSST